jgi:hypothetical protein
VILVSDSCHGGGMERSASAPGVKFRRMEYRTITGDQLKFPPPEISKLTEDDFQNITFVAAAPENKLTPEVDIEGKKRGALSWAFARGMEGRADKDGDGQVTELELLGYVVPAVYALVESQQTPQVEPLRARSVALVTLRDAKAPAPSPGPAEADELKLKLAVEGGDAAAFADLPFVTVVADKTQADLIWSVPKGTVEHVVGGVVAENVDATSIKGVLSKWAALKWLNHQAALNPMPAKFEAEFARDHGAYVLPPNVADTMKSVLPQAPFAGLTVPAASDQGQPTLIDTSYGVGLFTRYLIEGLAGSADLAPIGNGDGKLDSVEIYVYTAAMVQLAARKTFGFLQNPVYSGAATVVLSGGGAGLAGKSNGLRRPALAKRLYKPGRIA